MTLTLFLAGMIGTTMAIATETPAAPDSVDRPSAKDVNTPSFLYPTAESMKRLYQPYLPNLQSYDPMYFAAGTDLAKSKFQVSLKYRLLGEEGSLAKRYPWVTGFHFAYTQTSFWDLKSYSAPFVDTSYKPEIHFLSTNLGPVIPHSKGFFVQTGMQHESNGRDGLASRSTNFAYIKPMCVFYDETSKMGIVLSPKIWAYVGNDRETNPDLKDYRGYFDFEFKVGKADSLVAGTQIWWANKGGSVQLDLTYPLHRLSGGNLDVYLQLQYVNALAESLLSYKERSEVLRVGIALVR